MVTSVVASDTPNVESKTFSQEEFLRNPPEGMEWVDGQLVEKTGMGVKHGRIQARLARYWGNYKDDRNLGGEVYTETPCWTGVRGRRPDVSYLTPELVEQFGDFTVLSQSFPLIAEIISPTDGAEDVFTKVKEYLQSGCQEVWLVFPSSQWVLVITQQQQILFNRGDVASTQAALEGFSVTINAFVGLRKMLVATSNPLSQYMYLR